MSIVRTLIPRPVRRAIGQRAYRALVAADAFFNRDAPLVPPKALVSVGGGDFEAIGEQFLAYFRDLAQLAPTDRVLDVGCGIGRMAIPLTRYLAPRGSYDGFDVVAHGIEWCRRRVTPRFPNFRFRCVSVRNDDYNPEGSVAASEFVFPYPDASFDFVFLTSVFTHMLPADSSHYLAEASRVLAPGGRCFGTWFILDEFSRAQIAHGASTLTFRHSIPGGMTTNAARPGEAIAIDGDGMRAAYRASALAIDDPIRYGSWCGRTPSLSYQDIVVARKARPRPDAVRAAA